jgi:hypothetical protein
MKQGGAVRLGIGNNDFLKHHLLIILVNLQTDGLLHS